PFADYGLTRPVGIRGLLPVEVPRATGRDRLRALRAARTLLTEQSSAHDVVLLHDPELLLATAGADVSRTVWDVHEDTAAAVAVRPWLPNTLRKPAAWALRRLERWAESRMPLLLADHEYSARFRGAHPVVPNTTRVLEQPVPAATPGPDGTQRAVYLGSVTMERGAVEMTELGARLRDITAGRVQVHVVGPAHGQAEEVLARAHREGTVRWHGFVPSDQALPMLDGALAGLSLLHDEANFRPSMPTKVIEYLAHGIPAVSTPLPVPRALLEEHRAGVVVPFGDVERVLAQLLAWDADPATARETGQRGHRVAAAEYDWAHVAPRFVAALDEVAAGARPV
ncbi:glycosyltransferase family protein, partial [Ornithinicoccus halotolerans]|uniref:glycosyltransferase family protein n=1 Tax=Ornithinicoccus halotolerans TaxID=1748220 RepID=UPI001295F967